MGIRILFTAYVYVYDYYHYRLPTLIYNYIIKTRFYSLLYSLFIVIGVHIHIHIIVLYTCMSFLLS